MYNTQFVHNELVHQAQGSYPRRSYHMLEHTPVAPGTLTGRMYYEKLGQNFSITAQGVVIPMPADDECIPFIIGGTLNRITGEMHLDWSDVWPDYVDILVSYEYEMEVWSDNPRPAKQARSIDADWQTSAGWVYNEGEWQAICPNS